MKVPVYQQQAQPSAGGIPDRVSGLPGNDAEAVAQGAAAVGQTVDRAIADQRAQEEKAAREAQAQAVAEAATAYGNDITDTLHGNSTPTPNSGSSIVGPGEQGTEPTPGYLDSKGKDAVEASAPTLEDLQKKREKRAEAISDPTAKQLFLQHSAQMLLEARTTVERHVGQQIDVAKADTAAALADEAVRAASVDPTNDTLATQRISGYAAAVHHMGRGLDFEEEKALKLQEDVTTVRLDALIAQNDAKAASKVLQENRYALGPKAAHYEALIAKTAQSVTAEQTAADIVHRSLRPDGSVNDRAALDALDKVPADLADNVRPVLYRRMTEAEQAYKTESARVSQKAFSAFNNGGWAGINEGLKQQLNQRNPELFDRLKNEEHRRFRENRTSGAEARRQQAADNKAALQDYLARPLSERAGLDVHQEYFDSGADRIGLGSIAVQQQKDKAAIDKGGAVHSSAFVEQAYADAVGFLPAPGLTQQTKAASKEAVQDFKAGAERAWVEFVGKNERQPNEKEAADMRAQLIRGMAPNPKKPETIDRAAAAIIRPVVGGQHKGAVLGTGVFKTDKNGLRWEKMSDGSARQVK